MSARMTENEVQAGRGRDGIVSNTLFTLLGTTFTAIHSARKMELEPLGVSMSRINVLWALWSMERPTTVAEIAQITGKDYQSTSQLLNRMERDGFVDRCDGEGKRTPLAFTLTDIGNEVYQRSQERNEVVGEIMACLSPDERDTLAGCLKKLRDKAVTKGALFSPFPAPMAMKLGL